MRQGKMGEAKNQFQESLAIAKQLQSDTHLVETENNFAQVVMLSGRYDDAAQHYWKIIRMYPDSAERGKLGTIYSAYGLALATEGHYQRAIMHCQYALAILIKYPDTYRQIYALRNIGLVYQMSGDYNMARTYLIKARKCSEQGKFVKFDADVMRALAHNSHLKGCQAREEQQNFSVDCNDQAQALSAVVTSLEKARTIAHRIRISRSLTHLAYIFEEVVRLEQARKEIPDAPVLLIEELIEEAQSIRVIEDVYWQPHGIEHFSDNTFAELTLLQKVARLFEISALEAAESSQLHIAIENQIELARILIQLQTWKDVEKRLEDIRKTRSEVYDQHTLDVFINLLRADMAFDKGEYDWALTKYAEALPLIVSVRGTITKMRRPRINELLKRIQSFENPATAVEWCRRLQKAWIQAGVEATFPRLIERLQLLSHELVEKITLPTLDVKRTD